MKTSYWICTNLHIVCTKILTKHISLTKFDKFIKIKNLCLQICIQWIKHHWWDVRTCVFVCEMHITSHTLCRPAEAKLEWAEHERYVCVWDWSLVWRAKETHTHNSIFMAYHRYHLWVHVWFVHIIVPRIFWEYLRVFWFETADLHSVMCDHISVMSNKWSRLVMTAHRSRYLAGFISYVTMWLLW